MNNNLIALLFVAVFGGTMFLLGRYRQTLIVWRDGYRSGSVDHWRNAVRATAAIRRGANQRLAAYEQPDRVAPRPRHLVSADLLDSPTVVMAAPVAVDPDGPTVDLRRAA